MCTDFPDSMPCQRIAFLFLALCSWPVSGQERTAEETAMQCASDTLDSLRDETHKERMKIVWPLRLEPSGLRLLRLKSI